MSTHPYRHRLVRQGLLSHSNLILGDFLCQIEDDEDEDEEEELDAAADDDDDGDDDEEDDDEEEDDEDEEDEDEDGLAGNAVGDKRSLSKASGTSAGASSQAMPKRTKTGAPSSAGASSSGVKGKDKAKSRGDQDEEGGSENSDCVSDLSGDRYEHGNALALHYR